MYIIRFDYLMARCDCVWEGLFIYLFIFIDTAFWLLNLFKYPEYPSQHHFLLKYCRTPYNVFFGIFISPTSGGLIFTELVPFDSLSTISQ